MRRCIDPPPCSLPRMCNHLAPVDARVRMRNTPTSPRVGCALVLFLDPVQRRHFTPRLSCYVIHRAMRVHTLIWCLRCGVWSTGTNGSIERLEKYCTISLPLVWRCIRFPPWNQASSFLLVHVGVGGQICTEPGKKVFPRLHKQLGTGGIIQPRKNLFARPCTQPHIKVCRYF